MGCVFKQESVEQRVKREFGMDVLTFLQQCKTQKLLAQEVAELVVCSVSNIRRIMRKHEFSLLVPEREPILSECLNFKNEKINMVNCLSRIWIETDSKALP